jgi:hypothetical protein
MYQDDQSDPWYKERKVYCKVHRSQYVTSSTTDRVEVAQAPTFSMSITMTICLMSDALKVIGSVKIVCANGSRRNLVVVVSLSNFYVLPTMSAKVRLGCLPLSQ